MTTTQLTLPFAHISAYRPGDFIRTPGADQAMTWLERTEDWPDGRMALWGLPGCGKTHLLRVWAARKAATLHDGSRLDWRVTLATSGPIGVDDADAAPDRALLHLMNAAAEQARSLLLVARPRPRFWPVRLPDLSSRLCALADVELREPDDEWLEPLFARFLSDRQISVPGAVQRLLVKRLPRTPAAMAEAASLLDAGLLASGGRMTRGLILSVLDRFA